MAIQEYQPNYPNPNDPDIVKLCESIAKEAWDKHDRKPPFDILLAANNIVRSCLGAQHTSLNNFQRIQKSLDALGITKNGTVETLGVFNGIYILGNSGTFEIYPPTKIRPLVQIIHTYPQEVTTLGIFKKAREIRESLVIVNVSPYTELYERSDRKRGKATHEQMQKSEEAQAFINRICEGVTLHPPESLLNSSSEMRRIMLYANLKPKNKNPWLMGVEDDGMVILVNSKNPGKIEELHVSEEGDIRYLSTPLNTEQIHLPRVEEMILSHSSLVNPHGAYSKFSKAYREYLGIHRL